MAAVRIHGHAIVSADDRIATPDGVMPMALMNEADFAYFQAHLDAADLNVLGRLGHEAHPNIHRRRRVVVSTGAIGLDLREDAAWWNPAIVPWEVVAARLLPSGGDVAVPGGRRVFDLFLPVGYDSFHLARAQHVRIPGGVPVFSVCDAAGESAEAVLSRHGLTAGRVENVDETAGITRMVWHRAVT